MADKFDRVAKMCEELEGRLGQSIGKWDSGNGAGLSRHLLVQLLNEIRLMKSAMSPRGYVPSFFGTSLLDYPEENEDLIERLLEVKHLYMKLA
jgi:hypothetical protein